jgi:hypothetical protein
MYMDRVGVSSLLVIVPVGLSAGVPDSKKAAPQTQQRPHRHSNSVNAASCFEIKAQTAEEEAVAEGHPLHGAPPGAPASWPP